MLIKASNSQRKEVWQQAPSADGWYGLMEVMQEQGFIDNPMDSRRAASILKGLGFEIRDPHVLGRLLRALHLYYLPNITGAEHTQSEQLKVVHDDTLQTLKGLQPACWSFIGYFESAYHRLQQCFAERDVTALQEYLRIYCACEKKYKDVARRVDNNNNESNNESYVPLLLRLHDADSLSYQIWGLTRDYGNIVHQAIEEDWFQALIAIITAAVTHTAPAVREEDEVGAWGHFNQVNRFGDAPIHLAARGLLLLSLKHLLRVPALKVELMDRSGKNVLHLLFLRTQLRWNRFRRPMSISGSSTGTGADSDAMAGGMRERLDPTEAELVEITDAILNRAESAPYLLLERDRAGLSVMDYAMGLRSNRLLLVLLQRLSHNTASQYLDSAERVRVLVCLTRKALAYNQYDMVFSLARLLLTVNHGLVMRSGGANTEVSVGANTPGRGGY